MNADLSAVAVGAPATSVSANVLHMIRFFERGVPADDATCVRMMREVRRCTTNDIDGKFLTLRISDKFFVELILLPSSEARELAVDSDSDLECDVYGEKDEVLEALFKEGAGRSDYRELGKIRARATPDGCRQFVRDVRAATRALRDKGLCPKCPDQATASMRLPHASYCGRCCWGVVLLGDGK